jgi:protein-disulfide isomerase
MNHLAFRRCLTSVAIVALVSAPACSDAGPPARPGVATGSGRSTPQSTAGVATEQHAGLQQKPVRDSVPGKSVARATRTTGASRPERPADATRRIVFGDVDFTGVGHDRGLSSAPVVVIDLSDFACPYCGEFSRDVYPSIDREYVQTGKVLFKYIPFIAGAFPHSAEATRAAECAAEQGQFWPMLDQLYATQAEWKRGLAVDAKLAALAGTLPVDTLAYAACYANRHTDARTARATGIANEVGVRVTPSFLIDGNPVQGALPLAEFRKQIETALLLKSAQRPVPRRTP